MTPFALIKREPESRIVTNALFLSVNPGTDDWQLLLFKLEAILMLFINLLISPALGAVKFHNHGGFVFNADLIDTIFIAI